MPITMPQSQVDAILAALDTATATSYRAALASHGSQSTDGWEFASGEALQEAHDMFYPSGRPPVATPVPESMTISAPSSQPVAYEDWPALAKALKLLASSSDTGVGDTVARCLSYVGASTIADAYTLITGKDCGCADRQARLNALYPYSPPASP